MTPVLIDVGRTQASLQASGRRVSWSKIQQYEYCPGNWLVANHAALIDRTDHLDDSLHAIPGTLLQRVWQAIINDRLYRRDGLNEPPALSTWAGRQIEALFECIARPLEQQHQQDRSLWRRYFHTEAGKDELAALATAHDLDPALRSHLQPKFVQFDRLFALHGGRTAFFAGLAATFPATLATLTKAGLDLDGLLAETFVTARDGDMELAGSIDFIWNRRRSASGRFDDLKLLEDGYVVLDGKFRLGRTVRMGQLEFYATLLRLVYGRKPSRLGFLCYGTAELKLRDFNDRMTRAILARASLQYAGAATIASGLNDQLASPHASIIPIDETPNLTLTPSRLGCRFCGISEHCGAAAAAGTAPHLASHVRWR